MVVHLGLDPERLHRVEPLLNASIFALGIMPYISASIVIQLLGMAVPSLSKRCKRKVRVEEER